ncbi:hypothetical protein KIN20_019818 [Parelaphostrongylus tenuis]|uniref:Uncharacterized protein n=1 Tax=Parelaphostrongylus tenuis TaxID=148309 RepID=A0AAD5QQF4_PARTN|nr:hypothetical protein KIN20_019818 [Parelaphostrongylus tenuis]
MGSLAITYYLVTTIIAVIVSGIPIRQSSNEFISSTEHPYSPFGITCLIMEKILEIRDLADTARMLEMYIFTYPKLLCAHEPPSCKDRTSSIKRKFVTKRAWTRNISTKASVKNKNFIEVGTALYEVAAAIFIAQMNGVYLSFAQVITASVTYRVQLILPF